MEQAQLNFLDQLTPKPAVGRMPMTKAEKLAWLAENTRKHRMGAVDREEFLQDAVRRINQGK